MGEGGKERDAARGCVFGWMRAMRARPNRSDHRAQVQAERARQK